MSAGPSDRERISALESSDAHQDREIDLLREAKHRHAGMIQSGANDLTVFKASFIGWAAGFGTAGGLLAAIIMKLIER